MNKQAILCVDDEAIRRVKANDNVLAILRKPWQPDQLADIIRRYTDAPATGAAGI